MLTVNRYRDILLEEFYLDSDDMTIRRNKDGYYNRFKKDDIVMPFKMVRSIYRGIHIPRTRTSVSYTHLLTLLRGISIPEGSVVDHIDGNPENNIRSNIRIITQSMNSRNAKMKSNNTSGITGITKSGDGYTIRKQMNGMRKYGGYVKTLKEAKVVLAAMKPEDHGYTQRHGK